MTEAPSKSLLFVCTGNTCRSPMAERIMADRCKNLPGWSFASAGVLAAAGAPPSENAVQVLREIGIDLSGHLTRTLNPGLIRQADLLVAMTRTHRDLILEMDPSAAAKTQTLLSYGSENPDGDIMDPFGGGLDTYRIVRDEIEAALSDLLLAVVRPEPS